VISIGTMLPIIGELLYSILLIRQEHESGFGVLQ